MTGGRTNMTKKRNYLKMHSCVPVMFSFSPKSFELLFYSDENPKINHEGGGQHDLV